MELWHTHGVSSGHTHEPTHRGRVLTSTSGNAQCFPSERKGHLDFRKSNSTRGLSGSQYVVPLVPLGSNDRHGFNARLAAHKAKRTSHPPKRLIHDRPYLRNSKYLNYRERKRFDSGADGRPVWPDYVEEAFQNALVHIPPMGKYKKIQHGKQQGRNELISEWILQETGEKRSRKQVSSHIQVLGNLLKDDPDWNALTIPDGTSECHEGGNDYYFGSIADQVRLQRQIAAEAKLADSGRQTWLELLSQRYSLSRLNFDMWVGMPENMQKALHNYTHLQSSDATAPPIPLENLKNWRGLFPDLEDILGASPQEDYDIIGIKSRLSLMKDFPPTTSKLGLVLSLDFRSLVNDELQSLHELKVWSSVNHIYLSGQRISRKEYNQGHNTEPGVVASLAFEADWWATQFTKLTHKRKDAENRNDDGATASAEEYSRSLFRSLTVMQEVYASPHPEGPRKRMAILLWVFSQASNGHTGVTNWQKIVPPPDRLATNSPAPEMLESSLPPLMMDTMVDNSFDTDMTEADFSHDGIHHIPLSRTMYETNAYHSGYTPLQTMSGDPLRLLDFGTGTGYTPRQAIFAESKCEPFDFSNPMHQLPIYPPHQSVLDNDEHLIASHHLQQPHTFEENHLPVTQTYHVPSTLPMSSPERGRRRSLVNFDLSTHEMLQAQLGHAMIEVQDYHTDTPASAPAEASVDRHDREPESQQSMIGHMNELELEEEQMSQAMIAVAASQLEATSRDQMQERAIVEHPAIFESPKLTRPPLLGHNSFAGVLHSHTYTNENEQLGFDTPTRNDFARLINHHFEQSSPNDLFDSHIHFASDFGRPRSQPVLPSNDESRSDMMGFDVTPMQSTSVLTEIRTEQL